MEKLCVVLSAGLLAFGSAAFATETPHSLWLKAKCAVCHAEDGSGNTPQGHSLAVPDLRGESVQKMTDAQLTAAIKEGHSRMPSFRTQLKDADVALLVSYIRALTRR